MPNMEQATGPHQRKFSTKKAPSQGKNVLTAAGSLLCATNTFPSLGLSTSRAPATPCAVEAFRIHAHQVADNVGHLPVISCEIFYRPSQGV